MDRERIRIKLKELLAVRPRIEALLELTPSHDDGDAAKAVAEKEGAVERLERDRIKLMQARVALDRIDEGSYGICLACDSEVSEKRIEAVPWTPFCLKCQEKLDQRELPGFERYEIPTFNRSYSIQ